MIRAIALIILDFIFRCFKWSEIATQPKADRNVEVGVGNVTVLGLYQLACDIMKI